MAKKGEGSFEVEGFGDLFDQLNQLDEKTGARALMAAGRRAMKPVEEYQKAHAREDTGALRKSITTRASKFGGKGLVATVSVGPTKNFDGTGENIEALTFVSVKAIAQEFGNAKTTAHPFIRPSLENNQQVVINGLVAEFGKSFTRIKKRQAKKAQK